MDSHDQRQKQLYASGLTYALMCYTMWGVFPLYWKMLAHVPSIQILAHRIVWSLAFLAILLYWRRDRIVLQYLKSPRTLALLALTGALVGSNWFVYIYSINHNHIVEASLGYYINPLVNVLLGTILLREKLSRPQIIAVVLAFAGVAYLTIHLGRLPLVSLYLAFSFGFYGLLRKKANLQSMPSLMIETLILTPLALGFLWHVNAGGTGAFGHVSRLTDLLLILGGPVTALPLFWFGISATRIPLSTMGFIQYLSPTLQLLIGLLVYKENFNSAYALTFALVWAGLILFTTSVMRQMRQSRN